MSKLLNLLETIVKWMPVVVVVGLLGFGILRLWHKDNVHEEHADGPWEQVQNQNSIEAYLDYLLDCHACPREAEAEAALDKAQKERGLVARLARGHMPIRAGITLPVFSPDGRLIMAAGGRDIDFWDSATGAWIPHPVGGFEARGGRSFETLAFSPDGKRVAAGMSGTESGWLLTWELRTGKLIADYMVEGQDVKDVAVGPQGRSVVWLAPGPLGVWEPDTGKFLRAVHESATAMTLVKSDPRPPQILTASGRELWFWDLTTLEKARQLEVRSDMTLLGLSTDGALAGYYEGPALEVWDTRSGRLTGTLKGHDSEVISFCRDAKANWVVVGTQEGSIYLWDLPTARVIGHVRGHRGPVEHLSCSNSGRLVTTAWDAAKIWDLNRLRNWHEAREPKR